MSAHQFIWFDLETTGLLGDGPDGPKPGDLYGNGQILEWAAVLCEDDRDGDFAEVVAYTAVVKPAAPLEMSDFVRAMHTRNGLLTDVAKATTTLAESDEFLAGVCAELGAQPRSISLAGNSVHFDAAWIRVHMPRFAAFLSHRVFDVSTLIRAMRTWGPGLPDGDPAHRALDDVRQSIAAARAFRRATW
jgi:oligoribonuclease